MGYSTCIVYVTGSNIYTIIRTNYGEPKLPTYHTDVYLMKVIITHCSPLSINTHFHPSFIGNTPSLQTNSTRAALSPAIP